MKTVSMLQPMSAALEDYREDAEPLTEHLQKWEQTISSGVQQVTGRAPGTGSRAFTGISISGAAFR